MIYKNFQSYQKVLDLLMTGDLLMFNFVSNISLLSKVNFHFREVNRLILELNELCYIVWNFALDPEFKILIYVPYSSMLLFFKEIATTLKFPNKIVFVRTISGVLKEKTENTLLIVAGCPDEMLLRKAVSSDIHLIYGIYSKGYSDISAENGFYRLHNDISGVKNFAFLVTLLDEIIAARVTGPKDPSTPSVGMLVAFERNQKYADMQLK